jgi:hypothetical protein
MITMSNLHDFKKNPELASQYVEANKIQADGTKNFKEMVRIQKIIHKKE